LVRTTQENILEKYKDYIEFNALFYSKKGLEYDDVYNQCYLFLLENNPHSFSSTELKRRVNSDLRTYYNHEIKERHITYGTNPENIGL